MRNKKVILFVVNELKPGGAEYFVLRLAKALINNYDSVIFSISSDDDPEFAEHFFKETKAFRIYESPPPGKLLDSIFWKLNAIAYFVGITGFYNKIIALRKKLYFKSVLKKLKINIISSHFSRSDHFSVNYLKKISKLPVIITMHGDYNPNIWFQKSIINWEFISWAEDVVKKADEVICVADVNKLIFEKFKSNIRAPQKIYLGYKKPEKVQAPHPIISGLSNNFIFCMMGRGIPEKGWEHSIHAFKLILQEYPNTILLLVGPLSPYLSNLKCRCSNPEIIFTDYISRVETILPFITVGLLPSLSESLPYSIIEMFAYGKPVIASDVGEIKMMLDAGDNKMAGSIININSDGIPDCEQLYGCMKKYLDNDKILEEHSKNATLAFDKFDISHTANEYDKIFQKFRMR